MNLLDFIGYSPKYGVSKHVREYYSKTKVKLSDLSVRSSSTKTPLDPLFQALF